MSEEKPKAHYDILAMRGIARGIADEMNRALEDPDAQALAPPSSRLDFSETSLAIVESVVHTLLKNAVSAEASVILRAFRNSAFSSRNEPGIDSKIVVYLSFYVMELAHRNLGLEWTWRKRFLRGTQIGLECAKLQLFLTEQDFLRDVLSGATGSYRELKARITGIPPDRVELSNIPQGATY